MNTFTLVCILFVLLVLLGALYLCVDLPCRMDDCDAKMSPRTYRILTGCSFIIKFGMVLTAASLVGCLLPAGLGLAMAFAIPKPDRVPQGSWFDHSHNVATTMPFGAIVPIDWRFLQAGEKIQQNVSGFCRALQLKAPAMQDIDLKWATFFVPARLLCDKTEEIVSKPRAVNLSSYDPATSPSDALGLVGTLPTGSTTFPYFLFDSTFRNQIVAIANSAASVDTMSAIARSFVVGGLMDYLGFPVASYAELKAMGTTSSKYAQMSSILVNMLPLKAYHAICNHFFVDDCFRREESAATGTIVDLQTGQSGMLSITPAGSQGADFFSLRFSQYESDPFTKASASARIARISAASSVRSSDPEEQDGLYLNANTIRGMFSLDEFARKVEMFFGDMRKQIKLMFGIVTSDRSAMSPILVQSGTQPVQVSEVNNTSLQAVDVEATRQSAGKMLSSFGKSAPTFVAEELGVYMTLAWIRPRTSYLRRLPHQFDSWIDSNSIPNPLFAEIGDCLLNTRYVCCNPWFSSDDTTDVVSSPFGYNTRYVLEKYSFDSFTGDFRDNLAYWHCARDFDVSSVGLTYLNASSAFRQINAAYQGNSSAQSLNRIFSVVEAVDGARPFQLQFRFNNKMWQLYPHIDDEL